MSAVSLHVVKAPWVSLEADPATARAMERELAREVKRGDVLDGLAASAIARREERDDVLFELAGGRWAMVHLVWQAPSPGLGYPKATLFDTWESVLAQMAADAAAIE
jgi:hypothetical protein